MAEIVSGNGFGLFDSVATGLSRQHGLDKDGTRLAVNASNRNVVLQTRDEWLVGSGLNTAVLRTYNSQGVYTDNNLDRFRFSFEDTLSFDVVNSTVTRTAGDGSITVYQHDASLNTTLPTTYTYTSSDGSGAHDRLIYDQTPGSESFTWVEGGSQIKQVYAFGENNTWRLAERIDANGNTVHFDYVANSNRVARIWNDDLRALEIVYEVFNTTEHRVLSMTDGTIDAATAAANFTAGAQGTIVSYSYDGFHRLESVTHQLRTNDNNANTNETLVTTYGYVSESTSDLRVASVTQNNGVSGHSAVTSFTYNGSSNEIASITSAGQTTELLRSGNQTTVKYLHATGSDDYVVTTEDNTNLASYGKVTQVSTPTNSRVGYALVTDFVYDASGNLIEQRDNQGQVQSYLHDSDGNVIRQWTALKELTTYTYNNQNQLLSATVYLEAQSVSLAQLQDAAFTGFTTGDTRTTSYVYEANGIDVRFVVGADGSVTEHRYTDASNTSGIADSTRVYLENRYGGTAPSLLDMQAWVTALETTWTQEADPAAIQLVERTFSALGQLSHETTYTAINPDTTGSGARVTQYVYDPATGALSHSVDADNVFTVHTRDALGQIISTRLDVDSLDDGDAEERALFSVLANDSSEAGLSYTLNTDGTRSYTVYNEAGQLTHTYQSTVAAANTDTANHLSGTYFVYDSQGQLRAEQAQGQGPVLYLYDELGRQTGIVDAEGGLTEQVYNASGHLVETIRYANAVNVTAVTLDFLSHSNGVATAVSDDLTLTALFTAAVPYVSANTAQDRHSYAVYDAAGRQRFAVDAAGYVKETRYNGADQVIESLAYADALDWANVSSGFDHAQQLGLLVIFSGVHEADVDTRISTFVYDAAGRLARESDGGHYDIDYTYNAADQLVKISRREDVNSDPNVLDFAANDQDSYRLYTPAGQLLGEIDALGYLTTYSYRDNGQQASQTVYTQPVIVIRDVVVGPATLERSAAGLTLADLVFAAPYHGYNVASIPPNLTQATRYEYNDQNELLYELDHRGVFTEYSYTDLGQLDTVYSGRLDSNGDGLIDAGDDATQWRLLSDTDYDALGRVASEANGLAAANADAVEYSYDIAGNRISREDTEGNKTYYYYDGDGRLRLLVNALGEVRETVYSAFGEVVENIDYANAITTTGLLGGVLNTTLLNSIRPASDANDRHTETSYTGRGLVDTIKDPAAIAAGSTQATLNYDYNAFGQVSKLTQAIRAANDSRQTVLSYDRRGLQTRSETANNSGTLLRSSDISYDAYGNAVSITDANGHTTTRSYDKRGREISVTDAIGYRSTASYDVYNRVVSQTNAEGWSTSFVYDDVARTLTTRSGHSLGVVAYPGGGAYPFGGIITTASFNAHGEIVTIKDDASGHETRYQYDANGNLTNTQVFDATNLTTPIRETSGTYDARNLRIDSTDANGTLTTYTYDPLARRHETIVDDQTGGLALTTTTTYDNAARSVTVTDANGVDTVTTFDANGRLSRTVRDPTGLALLTRYDYDVEGLQVTVERGSVIGVNDAILSRVDYGYDALGRRTSETVDPGVSGLNLVTAYTYDANDNAVSRTDANGQTTYFAYNHRNQQVVSIDPLGIINEVRYNGLGQVTDQITYAEAVPDQLAAWLSAHPTEVLGASDIAGLLVQKHQQDGAYHSQLLSNGAGQYGVGSEWTGDISQAAATPSIIFDNYIASNQGLKLTIPAGELRSGEATQTVSLADFDTTLIDNGQLRLTLDAYRLEGGQVEWQVIFLDAGGVEIAGTAATGLINATQTTGETIMTPPVGTRALQLTLEAVATTPVTTAQAYRIDDIVLSAYSTSNGVLVNGDGESAITGAIWNDNGWVAQATVGTEPSAFSGAVAMGTSASPALTQAIDLSGFGAAVLDTGGLSLTLGGRFNTSSDINARWTLVFKDAAGEPLDPPNSVTSSLYTGDGTWQDLGEQVVLVPTGSRQVEASFAGYTLSSKAGPATHTVDKPIAFDNLRLSASVSSTGESLADGHAVASHVQTQYDALGQTTQRTVDPNGLALTTESQYDTHGNVVVQIDANGDRTHYSYDAANRRTQTLIDPNQYDVTTKTFVYPSYVTTTTTVNNPEGLNILTSLKYDGNGNVIERVDGNGNSTYYVYDNANRQRYTVDALGYVVENQTDAAGNVIKQTAYVDAVSLSADPSETEVAAALTTTYLNHVNFFVYDSRDRLVYTIDQYGYATETRYDANGQVYETIVFDREISQSVSLHYFYSPNDPITPFLAAHWIDNAVDPIGDDRDSRKTHYVYDQASRLVYTVDAQNYVTETVYDNNNQVVRTIRHHEIIPEATPKTVLDLQGELASDLSSVDDRILDTVRDEAGRIVYEIDGEGYVSEFSYDSEGNIISEYRYEQKLNRSWLTGLPKVGNVQNFLINSADFGDIHWNYIPYGEEVDFDANNKYVFYNEFGQQALEISKPLIGTYLRATSFEYDESGQVIHEIIHPVIFGASQDTLDIHGLFAKIFQYPGGSDIQSLIRDASGAIEFEVTSNGTVIEYHRDAQQRMDFVNTYTDTVDEGHRYTSSAQIFSELPTTNFVRSDYLYAGVSSTEANYSVTGSDITEYSYKNSQIVKEVLHHESIPAGTAITYSEIHSLVTADQFVYLDSVELVRVSGVTVDKPFYENRVGSDPVVFEYDNAGRVTREKQFPNDTALSNFISSNPSASGAEQLDYLQARSLEVTINVSNGSQLNWPNLTRSKYSSVEVFDESGVSVFSDTRSIPTYLNAPPSHFTVLATNMQVGKYYIRFDFLDANANVQFSSLVEYQYEGPGTQSIDADATALLSGSSLDYGYDAVGRLIEENRSGVITRYKFDANGNQTQILDPRAFTAANESEYTTVQVFDSANRKKSATNGGGDATATYYDPNGNILAVKDANGNAGFYQYDELNRIKFEINPVGIVTERIYNAFGNVIETIQYKHGVDANGLGIGDLPSEFEALRSLYETYTLEVVNGLPTGVGLFVSRDTSDRHVMANYNQLNQLKTRVNAAGFTELFSYSIFGETESITDNEGYRTDYVSDQRGNQISETRVVEKDQSGIALDSVVNEYEFDAFGNVITFIEGVGTTAVRSTEYHYDNNGLHTGTTYPDNISLSDINAYGRQQPELDASSIFQAEAMTVSQSNSNSYSLYLLELSNYRNSDLSGYSIYGSQWDGTQWVSEQKDFSVYVRYFSPDLVTINSVQQADFIPHYMTIRYPNGFEYRMGEFSRQISSSNLEEVVAFVQSPPRNENGLTFSSIPTGSTELELVIWETGTSNKVFETDVFTKLTVENGAIEVDLSNVGSGSYSYYATFVNEDDDKDLESFSGTFQRTLTVDSATHVVSNESLTNIIIGTGSVANEPVSPSTTSLDISVVNSTSLLATGLRPDETLELSFAKDGQWDGADKRFWLNASAQSVIPFEFEAISGSDESYQFRAALRDENGVIVTLLGGEITRAHTTGVLQLISQRFVSSPHQSTEEMVYDSFGNLTRETDRLGGTIYHYYNDQNRREATVDSERHLHEFEYDAAGNMVYERTFSGQFVLAPQDYLFGRPKVENLIGTIQSRETFYEYDADNRVIGESISNIANFNKADGFTDNNILTRHEYDGLGNLVRIVKPSGANSHAFYDALNNIVMEVDAEGFVIRYIYDHFNQLSQKIAYAQALSETALNNLISLEASALDSSLIQSLELQLSSVDPDNRVTYYEYDRLNRLTKEIFKNVRATDHISVLEASIDPLLTTGLNTSISDLTKEYEYDNLGRITRLVDEKNNDTISHYDGVGRLKLQEGEAFAVELEAGTARQTTSYEYDSVGNVKAETRLGNLADPTDNQTELFRYDKAGNVLQHTTALGDNQFYSYDLNGNIVVTLEERGHKYNDSSRDDNLVRTEYVYDARGQLISTIDSEGIASVQKYNAYGEISSRGRIDTTESSTQLNGSEFYEYFEYDNAGRLIKTNQNDNIDRVYLYDVNGNVTADIVVTAEPDRPDEYANINLKTLTLQQIAALPSKSLVFDSVANKLYHDVLDRKEFIYDRNDRVVSTLQTPDLVANQQVSSVTQEMVEVDPNDPLLGGVMKINPLRSYDHTLRITASEILTSGSLGRRFYNRFQEKYYNNPLDTSVFDGELFKYVNWEQEIDFPDDIGLGTGNWVVQRADGSISEYSGEWFGLRTWHTRGQISGTVTKVFRRTNKGLVDITPLDGVYKEVSRSDTNGTKHSSRFGNIPIVNITVNYKEQFDWGGKIFLSGIWEGVDNIDFELASVSGSLSPPADEIDYQAAAASPVLTTDSVDSGYYQVDIGNRAGYYDYRYTVLNASNQQITKVAGRLFIGPNSQVISKTVEVDVPVLQDSAESRQIHRQTSYNAFGEITKEIDGRGYSLAFEDTQWALAKRLELAVEYGLLRTANPETNDDEVLQINLTSAQRDTLQAIYTTDLVYDNRGNLIEKIEPETLITLTDEAGTLNKADGTTPGFDYAGDGIQERHRAVTRYFYDDTNRLIVEEDANSVLYDRAAYRRNEYDTAGNIIAEYQAHGEGRKTYGYDAFGNRIRETVHLVDVTNFSATSGQASNDAQTQRVIANTFNELNQLVKRQLPTDGTFNSVARQEFYAYDYAGRRIMRVDANGYVDYSYYDRNGRYTRGDRSTQQVTNISSIDAALQQAAGLSRTHQTLVNYQFDGDRTDKFAGNDVTTGSPIFANYSGGYTTTTQNWGDIGGDRSLIETTDYFGRKNHHSDLQGRDYWYRYDNVGRLTQQQSEFGAAPGFNSDGSVSLDIYITPGQNITYEYYNSGLIKKVIDHRLNSESYFEYDENGNRTFEKIVTDSGVNANQFSRARYDERNRLTHVDDLVADYSVDYEFDAVGNRVHLVADYFNVDTETDENNDGINDTINAQQEYWYDYDHANRFIITKGSLDGTATRGTDNIVYGDVGYGIQYNANNERIGQSYFDTALGGAVTETYTYNKAGLLETSTVATPSNSNQYSATRETYDLNGNLLRYVERASGSVIKIDTTAYDGFNRVETVFSTGSVASDRQETYYTYDDLGNLSLTKTQQYNSSGNPSIFSTNWYRYEYWDTAKQSRIRTAGNVQEYQESYNWENGFSDFTYNVNGHLVQVHDRAFEASGSLPLDEQGRKIRYELDFEGKITKRREVVNNDIRRAQNFYYFNGLGIGDVGTYGVGNNDYGTHLAEANANQQGGYQVRAVSSADFDYNFKPINSQYPATSPGSYSVLQSDVGPNKQVTLTTIATKLWGDGSLWYLLADANGINVTSSTETIAEGQVLVVPNVVTNIHNNSSTFKPYNAAELQGNIQPTLPDAPPPIPPKSSKQKCGGFLQIIIIVVAIVVTIVTAGAAAAALSSVGGIFTAGAAVTVGGLGVTASVGIVGAVVAGAVGAAVGSIASQLVGIAVGVQDEFSFSDVGRAALGGAVGGALQGAVNFQAFGSVQWANQAANAVISSFISQGIQIAVGEQDGFDWRQAAVAGISAPVTAAIGDALNASTADTVTDQFDWGQAARDVVAETVGAVATEALRVEIYDGEFNWVSVAGNGLGNGLVRQDRSRNQRDDLRREQERQRNIDVSESSPEQAVQQQIATLDTSEVGARVEASRKGNDGKGDATRSGETKIENEKPIELTPTSSSNESSDIEFNFSIDDILNEPINLNGIPGLEESNALFASAAQTSAEIEQLFSADKSSREFDQILSRYSLEQPSIFDKILGGVEIAYSGLHNSVVEIAGGVTSVPFLLDSVDAAIAVQQGFSDRLGYNLNSEGAEFLVQDYLSPLAASFSENVYNPLRSTSENYLGDGATTVLFAGAQIGLEVGGLFTGTKGVSSVFKGVTDKTLSTLPARGSARRLSIADALTDTNGNLLSAAERRGIKYSIRRIEAEGFQLDGAIKYSGNQGIDLKFTGLGSNVGRFALAEAKESASLGSLKLDKQGIRQGSFDFFDTRLQRAGEFDLRNELFSGNVDLFGGFRKSDRLFELNFPRNTNFRSDPDAARLVPKR